jgi:hypothetical protein
LKNIKQQFATAKEYRKKASECTSFNPTKKIDLAEKALDAMENVIGGLINQVEELTKNKGVS